MIGMLNVTTNEGKMSNLVKLQQPLASLMVQIMEMVKWFWISFL